MTDSALTELSPQRMRSQNRTYAMAIKKNATVKAMKIMSFISVSPGAHPCKRRRSRTCSKTPGSALELDQDFHVDKLLVPPQIGKPYRAALCAARRLRRTQSLLHGGISVVASKELRIPIVRIGHTARTRWRDSAATRPVRHISMAIVVFPAECNVLAGHVIECNRRIPGLERVRWISSKVGGIDRQRLRRLSVDGRIHNQIAPGIVDLTSTQCQSEPVSMEPKAVVKHIADKALLRVNPRLKMVAPN